MLEAPVHQRRPSNSLLHQQFPQDWSYRSTLQPVFNSSSNSSSNYFRPSNFEQFKLYNQDSQNDFDLFDLSQSSSNLRNLRLTAHTPEGSVRGEDSMQSESTSVAPGSFSYGQLTPNSGRTHHRESSLSSLGSTGPASPYTQSTSHPQVAVSDGLSGDTFYDTEPSYANNFAKTLTPSQTPANDNFLGLGYQGYNLQQLQDPNVAAMISAQRPTMDGGSIVAGSDFSHMQKQTVANTSESSSTPRSAVDSDGRSKMGETTISPFPFPSPSSSSSLSQYMDRWLDSCLQFDELADLNRTIIPKLDRTMTDIYQDELFNPSFTITSAPSTTLPTTSNSPRQDMFSQRLQAAKSQHLRASQSPTMGSGDRTSPFREGSKFAPRGTEYEASLRSAAGIREHQKAVDDAREIREHIRRTSPQQQSTPSTISPKEAFLDYHPPEEDAAMPLFPPEQAHYTMSRIPQEPSQQDLDNFTSSQQSFRSMATSRRESSSAYSNSSNPAPQNSNFTFAPPSIPGGLQLQQQYAFSPQSRRGVRSEQSLETPADLTSMESSTSGSEYVPEKTEIKRPARVMADSGTYTCTYHGCTLRFETPAKLQKHKREAHRQAAPLLGAGQRGNEASNQGMTSAALMKNSQAGPHKCERINPSTGKPCNTVFSRPYDLTRHEDTIHNSNKQKVRCHLCTEEKKFSRNDAFTRHMRVVHPEVDFPAKSRRRAHA